MLGKNVTGKKKEKMRKNKAILDIKLDIQKEGRKPEMINRMVNTTKVINIICSPLFPHLL